MKKPTPKNLSVIQEVLEDALKQKALTSFSEGPLSSLIFPESTKIPKNMVELREELSDRGYTMFYSYIIHKDQEVLSVNISKIE